jgi:ankyrin repeat protein
MAILSDQLCKNDILEKLDTLPSTLDGVYKRALDRIKDQSEPRRVLAQKVLTWLCHAARPLTLVELQHALGVRPEQERFEQGNLVSDITNLASSCAGLVIMDRQDDQLNSIIRLVHYTTQGYLKGRSDYLLPSPNLQIALTCLTYLGFAEFSEGIPKEEYPFLPYAARNWGIHAKGEPQHHSTLQRLAVPLLEADKRPIDTYLSRPREADDVAEGVAWFNGKTPLGLHIAAGFGLNTIVSILLDRGQNVNLLDENHYSPLHYAAGNNHTETIDTLIRAGADMSLQGTTRGDTALHVAALCGNEAAASILLDSGADVNVDWKKRGLGVPPLHEAVVYGHTNIVLLLLERGADISLRSKSAQETPLDLSCFYNRPNMTQTLLEQGAPFHGDYGKKSMSICAREGRMDILAMLVEKGVDPNVKVQGAQQPLDYVVHVGHGPNIKLLLAKNGHFGLAWDPQRPMIQEWRMEPWFPKLLQRCTLATKRSYIPDSQLQPKRELYNREDRVKFREMHSTLGYFRPRPILIDSGDELAKELVAETGQPYLEVIIPDTFVRLNKVIVTTVSRDQGRYYGSVECVHDS